MSESGHHLRPTSPTRATAKATVVPQSPSSDTPYERQRLKTGEIRLLKIDWNAQEDKLRLETYPVKLSDQPNYDTISYVWGTAPASVEVDCNGGRLSISPTAYEMLLHLRLYRPDVSRPLWIDAICIHQNDLEEKETQVRLMPRIYVSATQVVVWMGPSIPQTVTFMTDFPRVAKLAEDWTPTRMTTNSGWRGEGWPPEGHEFWTGLFSLLNQSWFKRLWTFQEIILASNAVLLCGENCVDADDFFNFVQKGRYEAQSYMNYTHVDASFVAGKPLVTDLAFIDCSLIRWHRQVRQDGLFEMENVNIPLSLHEIRHRSVQEQVDRVWAIAGLLSANLQEQLSSIVDYSIQGRTDYWKTHVRFAKIVFKECQNLTLLAIPRSLNRDMDHLPSWCPDLSGQQVCDFYMNGQWNKPIASQESHVQCLFASQNDDKNSAARVDAIKNHPSRLIYTTEDDDLLRVRGFVVDIISAVVEDSRLLDSKEYKEELSVDAQVHHPLYAVALDVYSKALNLARRIFYELEVTEARVPRQFIMSLLLDCRLISDLETTYHHMLTCLSSSNASRYYYGLDSEEQDRVNACATYSRVLVGHSFFATEGGRFGIAQPGLKPGDKVCAFYGEECLHILRWPVTPETHIGEHADGPAEFRCVAFIPYLMEQHERDAARLAEDEMFVIK
jgi:hypothetical protein